MTARHILAIGGLISDANSSALFRYALGLTQKTEPAVGFIATASGDAPAFIERFYETFRRFPCKPSHLPLFERTPNVPEFVGALDLVLVAGGNTVSMLGAWQPWGLPDVLRKAWTAGTVLVGWSAGAICWFESGISDAHAERLAPVSGLGFLPGSCCPHYSQDAARRDAFEQAVRARRVLPGWGIDDGAALHFENTLPKTVLKTPGSVGATRVAPANADMSPTLIELELPAS